MASDNLELESGFNLPKGLGKRRLGQKFAWSMTAFVVSVLTLGVCLENLAVPPEPEQAVVQYAANFSIIKAEGRESDRVYVTYMKRDCFLSGVHSAVAFHYKTGEKTTVVQFWPKWLNGETKAFTNDEFRRGPIQKVEFWGTARENSQKDGKITVTRVTFADNKSF